MGAGTKPTVVAIGTKNPVKIRGIRKAFRKAFPGKKFSFVPVSAESGVGDSPKGRETFVGAKVRAENSLSLVPGADYGVGVEGGLRDCGPDIGWFVEGVVAVSDKRGRTTYGISGGVIVPKAIVTRFFSEKRELGEIVDSVFKTKNVKQGLGLVGIMTGGNFPREKKVFEACLVALESGKVLEKLGET